MAGYIGVLSLYYQDMMSGKAPRRKLKSTTPLHLCEPVALANARSCSDATHDSAPLKRAHSVSEHQAVRCLGCPGLCVFRQSAGMPMPLGAGFAKILQAGQIDRRSGQAC